MGKQSFSHTLENSNRQAVLFQTDTDKTSPDHKLGQAVQ